MTQKWLKLHTGIFQRNNLSDSFGIFLVLIRIFHLLFPELCAGYLEKALYQCVQSVELGCVTPSGVEMLPSHVDFRSF